MRNIKSEFIFAIGLFILISSAVSLILNHQGFAQKIINAAFWIFTLATIKYIWETIKNEK